MIQMARIRPRAPQGKCRAPEPAAQGHDDVVHSSTLNTGTDNADV
jgi:hypothetical protein